MRNIFRKYMDWITRKEYEGMKSNVSSKPTDFSRRRVRYTLYTLHTPHTPHTTHT